MQGAEQGTLPKLSNLILMTTLLSYHHSFLNEETKVLQNEAMSQVYKVSDRPVSLIWFFTTLNKMLFHHAKLHLMMKDKLQI